MNRSWIEELAMKERVARERAQGVLPPAPKASAVVPVPSPNLDRVNFSHSPFVTLGRGH